MGKKLSKRWRLLFYQVVSGVYVHVTDITDQFFATDVEFRSSQNANINKYVFRNSIRSAYLRNESKNPNETRVYTIRWRETPTARPRRRHTNGTETRNTRRAVGSAKTCRYFYPPESSFAFNYAPLSSIVFIGPRKLFTAVKGPARVLTNQKQNESDANPTTYLRNT